MSKISVFLSVFYTVLYIDMIDDANCGYMFEKYSVAVPYKEL